MEKFVYNTSGVCSRQIEIELEGDVVSSVKFIGGCSGNTQGISSLVKGMKVQDVIERLEGIKCGIIETRRHERLGRGAIGAEDLQCPFLILSGLEFRAESAPMQQEALVRFGTAHLNGGRVEFAAVDKGQMGHGAVAPFRAVFQVVCKTVRESYDAALYNLLTCEHIEEQVAGFVA